MLASISSGQDESQLDLIRESPIDSDYSALALAGHKTRAAETLKRLAQRQPRAFVHWSMGYLS
jgi:hypothetical protein